MTIISDEVVPVSIPAPRDSAPSPGAVIVPFQDEVTPITAREFAWISSFMHRTTGVQLKAGKEFLVMGRLAQRLRHYGLRDFTGYIGVLSDAANAAEAQIAVNLLTTNETYFFREPKHFEFLQEISGVFRDDPAARQRSFRVWSAASSTGEEAYSAAMILAETLPGGRWQIAGTDVSTRVVGMARRGLYPLSAAERVPAPLLSKYCLRGTGEFADQFLIHRRLRAQVEFQAANLREDFSQMQNQDVVFLRNVMIYYDGSTKQELISRVERALRPGGYLLIGHSETLHGIDTKLQMVQPAIYRRVT